MRSTHCLPSYSFGGHEVFDTIPKFTKLYGKSVAILSLIHIYITYTNGYKLY